MADYDRELIARMLEAPQDYSAETVAEQVRLLREADNRDSHARTVRHSGGDGEAWRGIESAPRDGTWIDVWGVPLNGAPAGRFTNVQWFAGCFRFPSYSSAPGEYGQAVPADLTHWKPQTTPTEDAAMTAQGGGEK